MKKIEIIDCNKSEIDEFDSLFELPYMIFRLHYKEDWRCMDDKYYEHTYFHKKEIKAREKWIKFLIKFHNLPIQT